MFPGEDSGELAEIGDGGVGTLETGVGTPVEACGGMVLMTGEHMGRGWKRWLSGSESVCLYWGSGHNPLPSGGLQANGDTTASDVLKHMH